MSKINVLIIDDDPLVQTLVSKAFEEDKFNVFSASNGRDGLKLLFDNKPDIVILDIVMPEMDGWEACHQIRLLSSVPIIMLTSVANEENVIRGLDLGADDFLGKPFNIKVLRSRAKAVLRRTQDLQQMEPKVPGFSDEHLIIDFNHRKVSVGGDGVDLTRIEYRLLEYLINNAGRVLSYDQILNNVWGWEYQDSPDYVHVYISHLRKKIEKGRDNPHYLHTVYGVGYRFDPQYKN